MRRITYPHVNASAYEPASGHLLLRTHIRPHYRISPDSLLYRSLFRKPQRSPSLRYQRLVVTLLFAGLTVECPSVNQGYADHTRYVLGLCTCKQGANDTIAIPSSKIFMNDNNIMNGR